MQNRLLSGVACHPAGYVSGHKHPIQISTLMSEVLFEINKPHQKIKSQIVSFVTDRARSADNRFW